MVGVEGERQGGVRMTARRRIVVVALLVLAALSVLVAPSSNAQVLPDLPPLPAPPADGNLLADILGPASATACDAAATAYALVGPIAAAQLPPDLQTLIPEVDPYLALVTYACGYLVTVPSGLRCAADSGLNQQAGALGVPVALPEPFQIFYDTAAGIEHAFLRLGVDIGTGASQQLATALGCGVPRPVEPGAPAALPVTPPAALAGPVVVSPPSAGSSFDLPAVPSIVGPPTVVADRTVEVPGTLGQLGALRYPVRRAAALLLALPLVLLAAGVALAPRLGHGRRRRSRGTIGGAA